MDIIEQGYLSLEQGHRFVLNAERQGEAYEKGKNNH